MSKTIPLGGFNFEGPFNTTGNLRNLSGVYAILGQRGADLYIVDIGESKDIRDRVENHDRQPQWKRQGHSQLLAAALYVASEQTRYLIEQALRKQYNPPCGIR